MGRETSRQASTFQIMARAKAAVAAGSNLLFDGCWSGLYGTLFDRVIQR